jgi:hypothetical protein
MLHLIFGVVFVSRQDFYYNYRYKIPKNKDQKRCVISQSQYSSLSLSDFFLFLYGKYILSCEGKVLICSLKSKQISTIANAGLRCRTQVRGRLPLFSSSGIAFQLPLFSCLTIWPKSWIIRCDWSINKYWPIHGYIRETVIIHQKPMILTKQAIVLVNVGFGEYNGADRKNSFGWGWMGYSNTRVTPRFRPKEHKKIVIV